MEVTDEHPWLDRVTGMSAWQTRRKTVKGWSLETRKRVEPELDRGRVREDLHRRRNNMVREHQRGCPSGEGRLLSHRRVSWVIEQKPWCRRGEGSLCPEHRSFICTNRKEGSVCSCWCGQWVWEVCKCFSGCFHFFQKYRTKLSAMSDEEEVWNTMRRTFFFSNCCVWEHVCVFEYGRVYNSAYVEVREPVWDRSLLIFVSSG